jgi:hypothetical protein
VTFRPPVLGQDLVDRLRAHVVEDSGGRRKAVRRLRVWVLAVLGRPVRTIVVRLVDPSLQATLDRLRQEAAAGPQPATTAAARAELEVMRAELASVHAGLSDLRRRVDQVERGLPRATGLEPPLP